MKLLFYELSKVFSKKKVTAIILLLLGINLLLFYSENRLYSAEEGKNRPYDKLIEQEIDGLSPEESMEKLGQVTAEWDSIANYLQFKERESEPLFAEMLQTWLEENAYLLEKYEGTPYLEDTEWVMALSAAARRCLTQIMYIRSYPDFIQSVQDEADRMLTMSIFNKEGTFAYNNIIKTPRAYEGLERLELRPGPGSGVVYGSSYRLTDIFLLAILFLLCLYLFLHEEDTGLIRLVRTTERGRGATIAAKIGAMGLMSLGIAFLFHGSVFLLSSGMFSFGDLTRPVQSIQEFKNCTIPITVGQYIGIFLLMKMGITVLSAWLISLVFLLFKNIKSIFVMLAAFFGMSTLCYYLIAPTSWLSLLKYVNIFSFMNSYEIIGQYINLNCFSFAWNRLTVTLITTGGLLIVLPLAEAIGYLKNYSFNFVDRIIGRIGARWAYLQRKRPLRGHVLLWGHELRKILLTGRAWIFLGIGLYLCLSTVKTEPLVLYDQAEVRYRQYVTQWMGRITPETREAVESEKSRIDRIPTQMEQLREQYEAGEIDVMDYQMQYSRLQEETEVLSKSFGRLYTAYEASLTMEAETGYPAALVDELSSDYLFDNPKRDREKGFVFLLLILLSLSAVYSIDEERGIEAILRCTVKGRGQRLRAQLVCCAVSILFLWGCVYTPVITELLGKYTLSFDVPVQNIAAYRELSMPLSVGQFVLLKAAGSMLAGLCAGICVLVVSRFVSKQGFCIMLAGVLLLFPFLALFLGIPILNGVSLVNALVPFQISGAQQTAWLIYMGLVAAVTVSGIVLLYRKR